MSTLKECKVVMLPAKKQTNQVSQGDIFINDSREYAWGNLKALKCERVTVNGHAWNGSGIQTYINHLYVISDDEIKGSTWVYYPKEKRVFKTDSNWNPKLNLGCKKIIVTTDKLLRLPEPSQGFIEKYCEVGGIDTVMVEYNEITEFVPNTRNGRRPTGDFKLKVAKDNTITIKPVKDSWNREELYDCMQYYFEYCQRHGYVTPATWYNKHKHF